MTQTQQKSLISIVFILLIAGLIVSLNVDNQDTQSSVSVITPSNTNTSVDNHAQVTPSNNTNNTNTNTQANTNQTQDPFNPSNNSNNNSNQVSNEATNNDPRLPPGFPKPLPPLDKEEIKQTDALITEADGIIAKMDSLIAGLNLPVVPLSEQQQKELDKRRAIQQQKIKDIKAQLEALKQNPQ
ncbi:hypothetical protein [uncultured Gammaproteobacteria bacterium]|nr:hypothetical protein [uncultured Gammaproteobacteria bacterium]CAC9648240.1 hypothetical protein [uncultured Gammaproteobacteria bacterium]